MEKKLDIGMTAGDYRSDIAEVIDYTDFVSINEVMFNVCPPRRIKGTFNILRPFG